MVFSKSSVKHNYSKTSLMHVYFILWVCLVFDLGLIEFFIVVLVSVYLYFLVVCSQPPLWVHKTFGTQSAGFNKPLLETHRTTTALQHKQ